MSAHLHIHEISLLQLLKILSYEMQFCCSMVVLDVKVWSTLYLGEHVILIL